MQDRYYSDDISQVKRYKGRRKYEIFVHNKDFRELANKIEITLFKEDLTEKRVVNKKILSPSLGYARYVQACYQYIWHQINSGKEASHIQEYLDYLVEDSIAKHRLNEISDEEKYVTMLDKTYQLICSRIESNK